MGTQSLSICQKTTKAEQHTVWWPIQRPNSEGRCAPTQFDGSRNGNSGIRKPAAASAHSVAATLQVAGALLLMRFPPRWNRGHGVGSFKIGVLHLTKSLAKAYATKVRVNAVSPGPVWTGLFSRPGGFADQIGAQFGLDREGAVKKFLEDRYMPLGFGEPRDVANAVVFLASPLAKFITGANLDLGGTLRAAF